MVRQVYSSRLANACRQSSRQCQIKIHSVIGEFDQGEYTGDERWTRGRRAIRERALTLWLPTPASLGVVAVAATTASIHVAVAVAVTAASLAAVAATAIAT